jgi:hypothetical protein
MNCQCGSAALFRRPANKDGRLAVVVVLSCLYSRSFEVSFVGTLARPSLNLLIFVVLLLVSSFAWTDHPLAWSDEAQNAQKVFMSR